MINGSKLMVMVEKKIAVILPVYKKDKVEYLTKSLESIIYQTYKNIHLYIGVDGPVGVDLQENLKLLKQDMYLLFGTKKTEVWLVC